MYTRQDFIESIKQNQIAALRCFESNPVEIFKLFTTSEHFLELYMTKSYTAFRMIEQYHNVFEKLFTIPKQFYPFYKADPNLAQLFISLSQNHFSTVFQEIDDLVDLALLDDTCATTVLNHITFSKEGKVQYKDAKVCESLFQLAAQEKKINLCTLILWFIPVSNINQQDFDRLYSILANNPCIKRYDLEHWKSRYDEHHHPAPSYLSTFGLFMGEVATSVYDNAIAPLTRHFVPTSPTGGEVKKSNK